MIPIRLDIDMQGRRLRDAFLWHKDESLCTPEIFAERLVCDEGLPWCFGKEIAAAIRRQIISHSSCKRKSISRHMVLDIVIGDIAYHDEFEWDCSCSRNDPVLFAKQTCKDLGLPGSFEAAIAHAIEEKISRPRHQNLKRKRTTTSERTKPKTSVSRLNPSERARVKQEMMNQTRSSTTTSYDENLECPSDPMVVKWVPDMMEMKLPRQSHAFAEFRRSMRSQMRKTLGRGHKSRDQTLDEYIESVWNERTSPHIQQWFSKLAERRNALKNKEWRRSSRDDGVQYWEGEEANRKSLREGGELGDLLQQRKLPGLRLSRKNLHVASDLLRNSRQEERQLNFERVRSRIEEDKNIK